MVIHDKLGLVWQLLYSKCMPINAYLMLVQFSQQIKMTAI